MANDKIYLSAKRDGDKWVVEDQDGRRVQFVRGVRIGTSHDDMTTLSIDLLDASLAESLPYIGRAK